MTETIVEERLPGASRRTRVGIGSSVPRVETERFVRGEGSFVDDRQLPGMVHLAFVRSTLPHARIVSINTASALGLPGVRMVASGADAKQALRPIRNKWPLAVDRVRYVGEAIVVVVADSRYLAEDAAELVEIEYEKLPAAVDPRDALAPGAPQVFENVTNNCAYDRLIQTDGVDAAFASAPVIIELATRSARATAAPLEPRSYAAAFDERLQTVTLWTSSSNTFAVSKDVAQSLSLPETKVRVQVMDVGGSFGSKNPVYPEEIVVSWVAKSLRRPAKYTETRGEHLQATVQGRDQRHTLRAAFSLDGRILALEDEIIADLGATASADNSVDAAMNYVPGPYKVPEYRARARGVSTNKTPHGSLRGIGKADAAFAIERLMDHAARKLELDRAEIRLMNYIPESEFPFRTVTGALLDSGRYADCLRKAMEVADYPALLASRDELRKQGIHRGVGVTLVIEPTSASRDHVGMGFAACRLTVTPTGEILLHSGTSQQGQSHQTTLAQIVAGRLDLPMDSISVLQSDTHATPQGFAAGSSRSTTQLMSAAYRAAEMASLKMRKIASHTFGVPADELSHIDGGVETSDGRRLSIAEIANICYIRVDLLPPDVDPGFELLGTFKNPNVDFEPDEHGLYNGFATYPYDACVVVVDIDMETGMPTVKKYVSVHDCGNPINPIIVDTQHVGATMQGMGLALMEEIPFSEEGYPLVSGFMDYLLPTVNELPEEFITEHFVTPSPFTPHGGKGVGETGTLSPPVAFASAIEDAIGPPYPSLTELPLTAERIFAATKLVEGA